MIDLKKISELNSEDLFDTKIRQVKEIFSERSKPLVNNFNWRFVQSGIFSDRIFFEAQGGIEFDNLLFDDLKLKSNGRFTCLLWINKFFWAKIKYDQQKINDYVLALIESQKKVLDIIRKEEFVN